MKTSSSKPDPRAALSGVLEHFRIVYLNCEAVREAVLAQEGKFMIRAQAASYGGGATSYPEGWQVSRQRPFVSDLDPQIANLRGVLTIMETSPEYLEAAQIIAPLLASVAALEKQEAAERTRRGNLEQAHRDAIAAAEEEARAVALASPEVAAAAKALAAA
jgi:hypothetical protein